MKKPWKSFIIHSVKNMTSKAKTLVLYLIPHSTRTQSHPEYEVILLTIGVERIHKNSIFNLLTTTLMPSRTSYWMKARQEINEIKYAVIQFTSFTINQHASMSYDALNLTISFVCLIITKKKNIRIWGWWRHCWGWAS